MYARSLIYWMIEMNRATLVFLVGDWGVKTRNTRFSSLLNMSTRNTRFSSLLNMSFTCLLGAPNGPKIAVGGPKPISRTGLWYRNIFWFYLFDFRDQVIDWRCSAGREAARTAIGSFWCRRGRPILIFPRRNFKSTSPRCGGEAASTLMAGGFCSVVLDLKSWRLTVM